MNTVSEVSADLKRAMKTAGITQKELREGVGLSRQTMVNLLKGTEDFKLSTLLGVVDRLGLTLVLVPKAAASGLQRPDDEPVIESVVDLVRKRLKSGSKASD